MEHLIAIELTIPVGQLLFFAGLSILCLLWGRYKIGVAVSFCFTFYWAYIYNRDIIYESISGTPYVLILYFLSGIMLILCALCAFSVQD